MHSQINTSTVVTLNMSIEETKWLKAITRKQTNRLESDKDSEMRSKFWNALPNFDGCVKAHSSYWIAPMVDPDEVHS